MSHIWLDQFANTTWTSNATNWIGTQSIWGPTYTIDYSDGKAVITLEVPGFDSNDIKVDVSERTVYVYGKRNETDKREFKREFQLQFDPDLEGVKATCRNGLLTISVPQQPGKRRTIPVR